MLEEVWQALLDLQMQVDDLQAFPPGIYDVLGCESSGGFGPGDAGDRSLFGLDYVGIGTTDPAEMLEVVGNIQLTNPDEDSDNGIIFADGTKLTTARELGSGGLSLPYEGFVEGDFPAFSVANTSAEGSGDMGSAYTEKRKRGELGNPVFGVYGSAKTYRVVDDTVPPEVVNWFEGALGSEAEGVFARHRQSGNWAQLGCDDCAARFYGPVQIPVMPHLTSGVPVYYDPATKELGLQVSSARFKENIEPLVDDFQKVLQATPKAFTGKTGGEKTIGFIAEEFDALGLENLVYYEDGRPLGVRYEMVPIYLLEVAKSQAQAIEELKSANEDLKRRLETIEKAVQAGRGAVAPMVER
jgi:hypothetical protein